MNKFDEVKRAALELFATKGFTATSMQEIADAVGLNKATLYFYVKSKKELYLLIVEEQFSVIKTELKEIFQAYIDEPIDVLLCEAFKTIVFRPSTQWLLLWKRMHMLALTDLNNGLQKPLREIIDNNTQRTRHLINDFISAKNLKIDEATIASFIVAFDTLIHGIFDWRLFNPDADLDTAVPFIWDHFWNGSRFV